ncbi:MULTISPECIES: hypothetical protein [unclassified Streptomyces]|uniref:hypothetical protein n=1 Tax=unclassified Streptomyces TaxID=2593676 RepID=UPI0036E825B6
MAVLVYLCEHATLAKIAARFGISETAPAWTLTLRAAATTRAWWRRSTTRRHNAGGERSWIVSVSESGRTASTNRPSRWTAAHSRPMARPHWTCWLNSETG